MNELKEALRSATHSDDGSNWKKGEVADAIAASFFKDWFIRRGKSYHFLFKKNLRVTNIQFAELLALLKVHTSNDGGGAPPNDLQFLSVEEFRQSVSGIVSAFLEDHSARDIPFDKISALYADLLRRIVVVKYFFGSCAVYVPPRLDLQIEAICAESGYIHSCGRGVFVRNVLKAKKEHLFEAMEAHLDCIKRDGRVFFAVYSHEDFTDYDREDALLLKDGLDDVKVHVEKCYFGNERMVSVLNEMRAKFAGKLEIPAPGNFKDVHKGLRNRPGIDKSRTIWLIVDRSVGAIAGVPGDERFYIVFDQIITNKNPFHIFDENKPGWFAHTTMPHTLACAMINVTRPSRNSNAFSIVDPFAGTGTVYFEALKHPGVSIRCSDLDPIASQVAMDNLAFFSSTFEELQVLESEIRTAHQQLEKMAEKASKALSHGDPGADAGMLPEVILAAEELHQACIRDNVSAGFTFPDTVLRALENRTLVQRIFFYIALRASMRNGAALERGATNWQSAYQKECGKLLHQIQELLKQRKSETEAESKGDFMKDGRPLALPVFNDSYSKASTLSAAFIKARGAAVGIGQGGINALTLEKNSVDIIITDPPYGINTDNGVELLAELYADVIDVLIAALRAGGQLVLCLPDRSYTGRRSPYFTHKQLITSQVLAIASNKGRCVFRPMTAFPIMGAITAPPYYWESERALRRAILHFQFS